MNNKNRKRLIKSAAKLSIKQMLKKNRVNYMKRLKKTPQKTEKPQESCNYPVFEWYFSSGYKRCKNKNKRREIMIQLVEIK